jgi:hypothetical protein
VPVEDGFKYDEDDADHGELPLEESAMVNVRNFMDLLITTLHFMDV